MNILLNKLWSQRAHVLWSLVASFSYSLFLHFVVVWSSFCCLFSDIMRTLDWLVIAHYFIYRTPVTYFCWKAVERVATAVTVAATSLFGIAVELIVWFGFFKNSAFSSIISKSQMDVNVSVCNRTARHNRRQWTNEWTGGKAHDCVCEK